MYPIVNKTKEEYLTDSRALIEKGKKENGDKPYRVYTGVGYVTILPAKYASEIKTNPHLDNKLLLLQV